MLLRVVEELTFEEISVILDCKVATVRKRFERTRYKIQRNYVHEEGKIMGKNRGRLYHRNDNYLEELSAAYRNIPSPVRSSSEVTTNVINRLLNERRVSL